MENYGIPNNFFSDMCLGNSDDGILRALRIFNSSPTSDNLVAVLMNIISTIRYESLEGGPYKKIAEYFYNSSSNNNNSTFNSSVLNTSNIKYLSELLLKNALKNDENLTLKFDVKAHPFLRKEIEFHDDLKLEVHLGQYNSNELLSILTQFGQVTHFVEKIPSVNDIFIQTVSK